MAENIAGDERACHLDLREGARPADYSALATGLTGLTAQSAHSPFVETLAGRPHVTDVIQVHEDVPALRLTRHVRAFFQGNRFLIRSLLQQVMALVPCRAGHRPVCRWGLFGLALAATGADRVALVEGDPVSAADLQMNAEPFRSRARVERRQRRGNFSHVIDPRLQRL